MSVFPGRERILVDYDNIFQFGAVGSSADITPFVDDINYGYGMGVFNDPRSFGVNLLNGSISLNDDLDHIPNNQLQDPHRFRHMIDDHILLEGVVQPLRDRKYQMISPNVALQKDPVSIFLIDESTDFDLWHLAHQYINTPPGPIGYFNGYGTHGSLEIETTYGDFLRDMTVFGGGYAFEDRFLRMNFVAARASLGRPWLEYINETRQDLFHIDVSSKEGAVRNQAQTEIVRSTSLEDQTIRSFSLSLGPLGTSTLYVNSPEGSVAGNWRFVVRSPRPAPKSLILTKTDESESGLAFTVFNGGDDEIDVKLDVFATTYNTRLQENISSLNIDSSVLYGEQPLENFPGWGKDNRPLSEELGRLSSPLNVCTIELPILPDGSSFGNSIDFLLHDVGTIMRITDNGQDIPMMLGRKKVVSRDILTLYWELIELPLGFGIYDRSWKIDDEIYGVGVNTYIGDPDATQRGNYIAVGGKYIQVNGNFIRMPRVQAIAIDGSFLTIDNKMVNISI